MSDTPTLGKTAGPPLDSPAKVFSGKNLDAHTFLVTLSPKGDISSPCLEKFQKWVAKNVTYLHVVTERGSSGQLHLHACLIFTEARSKQRLQEDLWKRIVKPFHGDSIGKFAVVVTNMYNHEWYESYLKKEAGVEVLQSRYDTEAITSLFPTREQQEYYQATLGKRVSDVTMHGHSVLYLEMFSSNHSFSTCLLYLRTRMFKLKDMMVIQDERRVHQLAMALYRYVTGDCEESGQDREYQARHFPGQNDYGVPSYSNLGNPGNSKKLWKDHDFTKK